MYLDANLQFSSAQAITATADSTNVLDLGANRDMGPGLHPLVVLAMAATSFTHGTATATMTVSLYGAPNNGGSAGTYFEIGRTPALPLSMLQAGMKVAQFVVPSVSQGVIAPVVTTAATTASSTTMTVASATGLLDGMFVIGGQGLPTSAAVSGIVPGTRISTISGTTVTLDTAATVTNAAGTYFTFTDMPPAVRFLKLTYTSSTGSFTGGTMNAYLAGDIDQGFQYPPGIAILN
jgi:hypothetical protein